MKFFDVDHPMLRPIWVRLAIVIICLGWAAIEFSAQNGFWGVLFGASGAYCLWALLLNYPPNKGADE